MICNGSHYTLLFRDDRLIVRLIKPCKDLANKPTAQLRCLLYFRPLTLRFHQTIEYLAVMIDTLKISHRLQEAGENAKIADMHAMLLAEMANSELVSKENLKQLEYTLKKDLELAKAELQKEIQESKAVLQKEIQENKAELQKEIRSLDLKIENVKAELLKQTRELEVKISAIQVNVIKWVAGFLIGQTALLFTLIKLFG